ncbi:MAG: PilT/PilU family type 4a pilus ATPase [Candidatus Omnitrophica bacterium]|nr:PilT/PilU family type 4a pilus ATPase [Candidatus Omnitrophota bacterium]
MKRYGAPERRKSFRVWLGSSSELATLSFADKQDIASPINVTTLSPEGISFETNTVLPLSSEVTVSFRIPEDEHVFSTTVKIVRFDPSKGAMPYEFAAVFTRISKEDKNTIKQFIERFNIMHLLQLTIQKDASDLHLVVDQPPLWRLNGELQNLDSHMEKLSADDIKIFIYSILSHDQIRKFEQDKEFDFAIPFDDQYRFRVNMHQQRGATEVAVRLIARKMLDFERLNLPEIVKKFAGLRDGLVLVVGPANSGKTTTIAGIVDLINQNRKAIIITLERPIEYIHVNMKSIIKQREIGVDSSSFSVALKASLRQDPNVLVVGELDDVETTKTAIVAAQAGYLVVASFHAPNSIYALDRLVSMFPGELRKQILAQVASCLEGVIAQLLLPRKDGRGRILATEVLITTEAVKKVVRDDQLIQLDNIIQTGGSKGMQTMRASITKLVESGYIDQNIADFSMEVLMKGRGY